MFLSELSTKKVAFPFWEEANLPGFISSILSSLLSLCSNLDLYSVTEGVMYSENNATIKNDGIIIFFMMPAISNIDCPEADMTAISLLL